MTIQIGTLGVCGVILPVVTFAAFNIVWAQLDPSCNTVQFAHQRARIARLPAQVAQLYQPELNKFERQINVLISESRPLIKEYSALIQRHHDAVADSNPKLVEKYQQAVLERNPDLGRAGAENKLAQAVFLALQKDPAYSNEVQRRLTLDSDYDRIGSQSLRRQVEDYHRIEGRQVETVLAIPPPKAEYDEKISATAKALSPQAVSTSQAFQELIATVAAVRVAANASLSDARMDFSASQAQIGFDRPAPQSFAQATDTLRGAVRVAENIRQQYVLDLQHLDNFVPPVSDRKWFMDSSHRELPRTTSEVAAHALQKRNNVSMAYETLRRVDVPSPNVKSSDVNNVVERASRRVRQIFE